MGLFRKDSDAINSLRLEKKTWLFFLIFYVLSATGHGLIGYCWSRSQIGELILTFTPLFLLYTIVILKQWPTKWVKRLMWAGVGLRLVFLVATPALSDDYFRFIWDGRLLASGYNPYLYLPSEILHTSIAKDANLTQALYEGLNSPHYFTVYPPLNQLIFGVAAWLGQGSVLISILVLRLFIIAAEVGSLCIMASFRWPKYLQKSRREIVLVYALNPFVIMELVGNLHFEAVTLFFVLLALRGLMTLSKMPFQYPKSAVALGLGASVKLIPLIFLPLIVSRIGLLKGVKYSMITVGVVLALFMPFMSEALFHNFGKSLDLYFQKFEFNASIYYLLREIGFWLTGYNIIQVLGPVLSLTTLVGVGWLALQRQNLLEKMLLALTLYFLLATTVHPWYITTLVALGALTQRWYTLVWSALLPLTYVAYLSQPYQENLRMVTLEYLLVFGCLGYEFFLKGIDWEKPNLP